MPRLCNFFAPCAITCAAGYNAFPKGVLARRITMSPNGEADGAAHRGLCAVLFLPDSDGDLRK